MRSADENEWVAQCATNFRLHESERYKAADQASVAAIKVAEVERDLILAHEELIRAKSKLRSMEAEMQIARATYADALGVSIVELTR